MQNLGRETFFLAQQAQQKMLRADVLVIQPFSFFRAVRQHTFALVAQWQIHRSRNFFASRSMSFDLLPDRIHGRMRTQKAIGQLLIFPQQPEQKMLRLDVRAAKLARLVPREKYDSPGFFRVSLKHLNLLPGISVHHCTANIC